MNIKCSCGCNMALGITAEIVTEPGVPTSAILCPNCGKKIMILFVDMDRQYPVIYNKDTDEVEFTANEKAKEGAC